MKSWMISYALAGVFFSTVAFSAPRALVYKGEGVCKEGCAEASYKLAEFAGLDPVYVGPNDLTAASTEEDKVALFKDAVIWLQPGGYASTAMNTMSGTLKNAIKKFISDGGGYVGFCAGAFVATEKVGATNVSGLNIFPGGTKLYGSGVDLKLITWNKNSRYMYWEGGPYFRKLPKTVEVTAYYSNGAPVSARTLYGKGKVYITGVHLEAPQDWIDYTGESDTDGLDFDLGLEMIKWVTNK